MVIFILVYGAACKIYREDLSNNFEMDPFEQKFELFKNKYKEIEDRERAKGDKAQPIKVPKCDDVIRKESASMQRLNDTLS